MNVLVTGYRGFIGRAVTKELVSRGHWVRLFSGDVRNQENVAKQVHHYDVVIHLAAKTPGWDQPIAGDELMFYLEHNVSGAINVAASCEAAGKPLIFAATRMKDGPYGRSKNIAESVLREEYGALALRVSMAYGPGQPPPFPYGDGPVRLVPQWVCNALTRKPLTIRSAESTIPDLVYIDDVAEVYADYAEFMFRHNRLGVNGVGALVDIAGPGSHNLYDIALFIQQEVARQKGWEAEIIFDDDGTPPPPPGNPGNGTPLTVGIRKTVNYYRSLLDL